MDSSFFSLIFSKVLYVLQEMLIKEIMFCLPCLKQYFLKKQSEPNPHLLYCSSAHPLTQGLQINQTVSPFLFPCNAHYYKHLKSLCLFNEGLLNHAMKHRACTEHPVSLSKDSYSTCTAHTYQISAGVTRMRRIFSHSWISGCKGINNFKEKILNLRLCS